MINKLFLFFALSFILSIGIIIADNEIMDVKLDKNSYSPGENISIFLSLFSGNETLDNANISITFNSTNDSTLSDTEKFVSAPLTEGTHTINFTYNSTTITKTIKVSSIKTIELSIISSSTESYEIISFSNETSDYGITGTGSISGELLYSNFTNNGTTYFVILQKNEETDEYDSMFIAIDASFATIKFQYVSENSKISLNDIDYTSFYIDPAGQKAIILRQTNPVFFGSGDEYAGLFILALNSSGAMISSPVSLTIDQYDNDGNLENITNDSISSFTVTTGFKAQDLYISTTGGQHNIIVGQNSIISYFVNKYTLKTTVETLEGNVVSTASNNQILKLKSSVVDLSTGLSVNDTEIISLVISPNGLEEELTLENDGNNIYTANFTTNSGETGEYTIIFTANYSGDIISKEYKFSVKSSELFMKAFNPSQGKGDGFSPGVEGILIIGGNDLSTNEFLNLSDDLTNNCNNALVYIESILDENKINRLRNFNVYNLSSILTLKGAEPWVINEMNEEFGEKSCAINFTAPTTSGTYKIEVVANVSGTVHKIKNYIDITSLFIFGAPANCNTGGWAQSASPGAEICIKPTVYDTSSGREINSINITELSLIEVFSLSSGKVITDLITNITIINFSNGKKGLSFLSSNTSIGDHDLKFKVKANVSGAIVTGVGRSFYRTEIWSVFAHPDCSDRGNQVMHCNFGSDSNITLKIDAFSAGFGSGEADLVATVASVKNFETGETIDLSDADANTISCTTEEDNSSSSQTSNSSSASGTVLPASCTITITAPSSGWSSGGHQVEITVVDTNDNSMSVYSWFSIENFQFWAWNRNFETTKGQDAEFEVTVKDFAGNNIDANVTVSKVYYMGNEDKWMEPKEVTINTTLQNINGTGTYIINQSSLTNLKSGFYDLVFTARTSNGQQNSRAGFNIKSFVSVAFETDNNFAHSYKLGGNLTINISAYDTINWQTWPPSGTPHNITNATVKRINKNGMWDKPYLQSGKNVIGDTNDCTNDNNCILTVPLTGFEQSHYDMLIEVTDENGQTSTAFYWFRTETFTITVPEINDWRTISASNRLTDVMSITLSTDVTCGTTTDTITEPSNVTNCLFEAVNLPTIYASWENQELNKQTMLLLDKTNSSNPILYVNLFNPDEDVYKNYTRPQTVRVTLGQSFIDSNGYNWTLNETDAGLGELTLKSVNGVIRSNTKSAGQGQSEVEVEYIYQYLVNKSLSQSNVFLYSGNGMNEDKFWDDRWGEIDLDNDGLYNCNDINGTWSCEEYFMLLSDRLIAGSYDTLILSRERNMTAGVNSFNGLNGTGAIRINATAKPIYLLNIIYSEENGAGRYKLVHTTNKAGWPGRNLGVFQVGSEHLKIPVMILSPSTRAPIADQTVVIRTLRTSGGKNFEEYSLLVQVSANTSTNGIALLDINVSDKLTGEYSIIMEVMNGEEYITSGNDWDNPRFELRSFAVSSLLGIKARLTNMITWSEQAGNLVKLNSAESMVGDGGLADVRIRCEPWNNDLNIDTLCHADDWRFKELWVNISEPASAELILDPTPDDWRLTNDDLTNGQRINLSSEVIITNEFGGNIAFNFENVSLTPQIINLSIGVSEIVRVPGSPCELIINLNSANQSSGVILWSVNESCPWTNNKNLVEDNMEHSINQPSFMWGGMFNISTIDLDNNGASFNLFKRTITLASNVPQIVINDLEDQNDGRIRVITNASDSGYTLYIYNSNQTKTQNDLQGWSGSLDKVAVVNMLNDSEVITYGFGEAINQLNGKAIVKASSWDQYVYLSNLSFNGEIIFPLPWSCDNNIFYVGNFTEEELGFNLYECGGMGTPLSSRMHYILLYDNVCDGISQITNAKFDDDRIIDDGWVQTPSCIPSFENNFNCWASWDYSQSELGEENQCNFNNQGNQSEQNMDLGKESWPITITGYSNVQNGELDLFKVKWGVNFGENITEMDLWVQAKNFDGTQINGDISIEKATGMSMSCGMFEEEVITIPLIDGVLSQSTGYLSMDLSNLTTSNPTIKFKVNDNSTNGTRYEYITKSFYYAPGNQNMMGGEQGGDMGQMSIGILAVDGPGPEGEGESQDMCSEKFKGDFLGEHGGGTGGSGGGPGFFDEETELEMNRCMILNATGTTCEDNNCVKITTGFFDGTEPLMDVCMPCAAFDKDEEKCTHENYIASCTWVPIIDSEISGDGLCESII